MNLGRIFTRIVLPLVLFVLIIGAVALLRQMMPNRASTTASDESGESSLVEFNALTAEWYKDDPQYFKEYEQHERGHYDYRFKNVSGKEIEMGVQKINCDCSGVNIALLADGAPKEWHRMRIAETRDEDGETKKPDSEANTSSKVAQIAVPPGGEGLLRLHWDSRRAPDKKNGPTTLRLKTWVWFQPSGQQNAREQQELVCYTAVIVPVMFLPFKKEVGEVNKPVTADFLCWSSTRSRLRVGFDPAQPRNPCFVQKIEPLASSGVPELLDAFGLGQSVLDDYPATFPLELKLKAREQLSYRLRSAFYLHVTIYPEKEGKQLDLGYHSYVPRLLLDGTTPIDGPTIGYFVRSDIEVGQDGKVNLKTYPRSKGTYCVIPIIPSDPKVKPTVKSYTDGLEVKLSKNEADSTPNQTVWNLEVVVPPFFTLGEDTAVVLQISETRQIRIPIVGNPTQG